MQKLFILLICMSLSVAAFALNDNIPTDTLARQEALSVSNEDLLFVLLAQQKKELQLQEDSLWQVRLEEDVTTANPFHIGLKDSLRIAEIVSKQTFYPLCLPLCYVKAENKKIQRFPLYDLHTQDNVIELKGPSDVYAIRQGVRDYITTHRADLYKAGVYNPDLVKEYQESMNATTIRSNKPMKVVVDKGLTRDAEEDKAEMLRLIRDQRSNWRREATTMLQVTQNYATENWYQGSNTNFALLGVLKGFINYDNRKNITWENSGEWRVGMNTVQGDTVHPVNMNDDVFKLSSKLGVKVYKQISVALAADFQTHFFPTWKMNSSTAMKTGTVSPIRFNLSLGLDYKPVKGLSLAVSPVTYKMIYVNDTLRVDAASFGVTEGNILHDVGSSLRVIWKYKPLKEIELESNFYFYTNYTDVEIDWEITSNFIINRYLSACVTLHPRYDTSIVAAGEERKFKDIIQFKELISLGFNHKFH